MPGSVKRGGVPLVGLDETVGDRAAADWRLRLRTGYGCAEVDMMHDGTGHTRRESCCESGTKSVNARCCEVTHRACGARRVTPAEFAHRAARDAQAG